MKHYVVGFLFTSDKKHVVLVKKNRPKWQVGLLNGVGGHIEENESSLDAIKREFCEETGLHVLDWNFFVNLKHHEEPKWRVSFFWAISDKSCQTMTDEEIGLYRIGDAMYERCVPNLRWLIPLALDGNVTANAVEHNWPHED